MSPHEPSGLLAPELRDAAFGLVAAIDEPPIQYASKLSLEGFGQPYVSSGGSRYGTFLYGGTSFLFGDMLGGQKLGAALQLGTRREDFAAQIRYLNRQHRWSWGTTVETLPYLRGGSRDLTATENGETVLTRETELVRQNHSHGGGFLSYSFSRAERIELSAGVRHITSDRQTRSRVFSPATGKLLRDVQQDEPAGSAVTLGEPSVALVYDSAVWGPASPILGTRSRVELSPSFGGLSFASALVDYRRYFMPVRPYTIAARLQYSARYGRDAGDTRLQPLFVGYRNLVRGYDLSSIGARCTSTIQNECEAVDRLIGTRSLVANVEVRFPLAGLLSRRQTYGSVPLEGLLFADGGLAGGSIVHAASWRTHLARSAGAGVRIAPFGLVAEIGAARTFDHPLRRWTFLIDFRPGF